MHTVYAARRDAARLAYHAEAAGDRRAVLEYAPIAAQQAAALRAHREAAAQFERARRFADDLPGPDRARLCEGHAYECYLTDQHAAAIAARRQALRIWRAEDQPVKVGENLRWLSRLSWFVGQREEAEAAAHEAIAILTGTDSGVRWPGPTATWRNCGCSGPRTMRPWPGPSAPWPSLRRSGSRRSSSMPSTTSARPWRRRARRAGWRTSSGACGWRWSSGYGLEEHVARAWTNLASAAEANFQFAASDCYVDEGMAYATEHDLDAWRILLTVGRAEGALQHGQWSAAVTDTAWLIANPAVPLVTRVPALTILGQIGVRRGDPGATDLLANALRLAAPVGDLQSIGPIRAVRAEAADLAGDRRGTAAEVRAILALAVRQGGPLLRSELAYWLWRAGEPVDALGDLAEPFAAQIAGDWRGAAAAWDEHGRPYEAARAREEGDDEADLRAALATFERLGARPMVARTARRLRELGARIIPSGPRAATRANPAGLTA